jgi:tetratricopeptide (TPR) repeat protein
LRKELLPPSKRILSSIPARLSALWTHSVFVCVTAIVGCQQGFAQTPDAHQHPDREYPLGIASGPQASSKIEEPVNDGLGVTFADGEPQALSGVVTLHELSHQVPAKARKEYEKASNAMAKGDLTGAIGYFKEAVGVDPEFSSAINALGTLYLHKGYIAPAIEEFAKAITVDPHAPAPYYNLAIAYLRQGRYSDGERAARRVVDLDRVGSHGPLVLGISLVLQKKFTAEAEENLRRAVSDFAPASLWLAMVRFERGNIADARSQLEIYLRTGEKSGAAIAKGLMQQFELVGRDATP